MGSRERKNRLRESLETREMKLVLSESPLHGHNKATPTIGAPAYSLGFSSRSATFADLLLFVQRLHLLLLTHLPRLHRFLFEFAVPSLVPSLHLPSSLIKWSNYATSRRLSFSDFLPISFSRPPSRTAIFSHCLVANETGHTYIAKR